MIEKTPKTKIFTNKSGLKKIIKIPTKKNIL